MYLGSIRSDEHEGWPPRLRRSALPAATSRLTISLCDIIINVRYVRRSSIGPCIERRLFIQKTRCRGMGTEVAVMSLTAREKHALHAIEDRLAGSDPRLASRLATFTRLTSGEEMPTREMIQRGCPLRQRRDGPFQHARRLGQHMGWQRAMLLLCLAVAVVEGIVVTLAVGLNGPEAPLDASRPCNLVLERLSGCPRKDNVTNAAGGRLGMQLTTEAGYEARRCPRRVR